MASPLSVRIITTIIAGMVSLLPPGSLGLAQGPTTGHPSATHVGPAALYPNPALTPGVAETVDLADLTDRWECPQSSHKEDCTYSQAHRSVSAKVHNSVYDEYNVPQNRRNAANGEVDHFDPLCNGGSNDIKNLWYQPVKNPWNGKNFGYHEKDDLESWVCVQVKAGIG